MFEDFINYNPETGCMTWRKRDSNLFSSKRSASVWNARYAGKKVGTLSKNGYCMASINNKSFYLHRVAFEIMTGRKPHKVDHINGDRTDNKWSNLREVSDEQNARNMGVQRHRGTGVMGVRMTRNGNFAAHIRLDGRQIHLGTFKTIEEAAEKRLEASRKYGYHENHGTRLSSEESK